LRGFNYTVIEVTRSRVIAATPDRIWQFVGVPARLAEWFDTADRVEDLGGDRLRLYAKWGRNEAEIDVLVVDRQPARRLGWVHEAERLKGKQAPKFALSNETAIELAEMDVGTEVTIITRIEPAPFPKGLLLKLAGVGRIGKSHEKSLEKLEELVS
jgi:uncharacterized protein YndB with AHSA1/START domain